MQVVTFNFVKLVEEAQNEFDALVGGNEPLTQDQKDKLGLFFQAFVNFGNHQSNWGYDQPFYMMLDNVPSNLYNEFQLIAKKTKIPINELFNILFQEGSKQDMNIELSAGILSKYIKQKARYSINHMKILYITSEDLEDLDYPVSFNHIRDLKFHPNISEDLIFSKVSSINHCAHVTFPQSISKLAAISKVQFCNEISFYDEFNKEETTED